MLNHIESSGRLIDLINRVTLVAFESTSESFGRLEAPGLTDWQGQRMHAMPPYYRGDQL